MKIVAVAACTTGIAHTYMAKVAIEQEAKKRGHDIKVETQGAIGIEDELSQKEVNEADVILLAISVAIEGIERFEKKDEEGKIYTIDPSEVIKSPEKTFNKLEKLCIR